MVVFHFIKKKKKRSQVNMSVDVFKTLNVNQSLGTIFQKINKGDTSPLEDSCRIC